MPKASSRQNGTEQIGQIEITPEMAWAGVLELRASGIAGEYESAITLSAAEDVFRAMWAARPTAGEA